MDKNKLEKYRSKLTRLLLELEAILVLVRRMTREARRELARAREEMRGAKNPKPLGRLIRAADSHLEKLRQQFGVRVPGHRVIELFRTVQGAPARGFAYVRKISIEEIFSRYERVFPLFADFPPHGLIVFDPRSEESGPTLDWFLLEAKLFEDMAGLFNQYRDRLAQMGSRRGPIVSVKYTDALWLGAVAAAFSFIESYLNGLATDYWVARHSGLDPRDRKLLTEWDWEKNRPAWLSVRDKALQYPKIVLGAREPPLQESNCPELSFFVTRAKALRDAVMHASPLPDPRTYGPEKEEILLNRTPQDLEEVVDNCIGLVQKIETTISGDLRRVPWLVCRNADGYFPNSVFK